MGVARGERNPKDSMKSTWRTDKSQWGVAHYLIDFLNVHGQRLDTPVPVHAKSDSMKPLSDWSCHRWILFHAGWPILLQRLYVEYTGENLSAFAVAVLYTVAFQINSIREINALQAMGHEHGFLDGDKQARDGVPDHSVTKVFFALTLTLAFRPTMAIFLAYNKNAPVQPSVWLPVELALYSIVLDFWFYVYHRACHEFETLWRFHRTHHLAKHPNPLLSPYSDTEQEILEIALIPLVTYVCLKLFGFPMGFYDWWICHCYLLFTEAFGHSGLRVYSYSAGTLGWLLSVLNCELTIEDHDLPHRKGWRTSYNYGKQTRVWDRVFGTCHDRLEGDKSNVDWENPVHMPLL